jgi:hypothetical protein
MPMPTLYFHLRHDQEVLVDVEGVDIAFEDAINRALDEARGLIAADALHGRIDLRQCIEVENDQGEMLHRVPFEEAVEIIRLTD